MPRFVDIDSLSESLTGDETLQISDTDKIAKWKRKGIIRMDGDRVVFSAPPKDAGYLAEELMYEVGDIMWFCAGLARQFGWSLENVCWANLNKLSSRQERGVIEGDGDNR